MPYSPGVTYQGGMIIGQALRDVASIAAGAREQQRAQKERDRALAEEVKRFAKLAEAYGMPRGEIEAASLGDLQGFVEGATARFALERAEQQAEQIRREFREGDARELGVEALALMDRAPGIARRPVDAYAAGGGGDPQMAAILDELSTRPVTFEPGFMPAEAIGGPAGSFVFSGKPGEYEIVKGAGQFRPEMVDVAGLPEHLRVLMTGPNGATVVNANPRGANGPEFTQAQRIAADVEAADAQVAALEQEVAQIPAGVLYDDTRNQLQVRLQSARATAAAKRAEAQSLGVLRPPPTPPPSASRPGRVLPAALDARANSMRGGPSALSPDAIVPVSPVTFFDGL